MGRRRLQRRQPSPTSSRAYRTSSSAETVDYPPLCADVGHHVTKGSAERGIVVGGFGSGEQIACNKIPGVRAGVCHDLFTTEIARAHNDANILILGAKIVAPDLGWINIRCRDRSRSPWPSPGPDAPRAARRSVASQCRYGPR